MSTRPRIDYFALGGTIASIQADAPGAAPRLTAAEIASSVEGLADVADLHTHQIALIPSPEITITNLQALVAAIGDAVDEGAVGAVVTQGTDTIEESAFVVDLLWDRPEPVVFTGAMRNPSLVSADGPANLLAAVQLAASAEGRDAGVLICLNDEIHAARHAHKSHTSNAATFVSPGLGPLGWISEGRPVLALRPTRRNSIPLREPVEIPNVALVKLGLADDCQLLEAVLGLDFQGVVIESMGGGHIPSAGLPAVDKLVRRMPVVLASRTGAGEVLSETYRFPGSEIDLLQRGVLRAGALDAVKARLLLTLSLAAGHDRSELARVLAVAGTTTGPVWLGGAQ